MYSYPIEIISGEGLGYSDSSYKQIGPLLPMKSMGDLGVKLYVNVATGNRIIQDRAVRVMDSGKPFDIGFIYNSGDKNSPWYFINKKFQHLPAGTGGNVDKTVRLKEEDGHETIYTFSVNHKSYYSSAAANEKSRLYYDELQQCWVVHNPAARITEHYDQEGFLRKKIDFEGRERVYGYSNGQLIAITDFNRNHYEIRRVSHGLEIVQIGHNQETILQSYIFDELGRLRKNIIHNGGVIEYNYLKDTTEVEEIIQSDGMSVDFEFENIHGIYHLKKVFPGRKNENVLEFKYDKEKNTIAIRDGSAAPTEIVVDNNNRIKQLIQHNGLLHNISLVDDITSYDYNSTGQLATITAPNKGIEQFDYQNKDEALDVFGLIHKNTRPNGEIIQYYYDRTESSDPVLIAIGKKLNEASQELATRYIYDSGYNSGYRFLRFEISPCGRIKEHRQDKNGNIGSTREYTHAVCDLIAHIPAEATLGILTMLKWLEENKIDPQQITLSEFGYDAYGQLENTRHYATISKTGEGIEDEFMSEEAYTLDAFGNLLKTRTRQMPEEDAVKPIRNWHYDKLNRLEFSRDELDIETNVKHNDEENETVVIQVNGLKSISKRDKEGLVTTETESAVLGTALTKRETKFGFDGGCIKESEHPDGQRTYTYYDMQRRLGMEISPSGIVIEKRHNKINRYEQVYQYAKLLDFSKAVTKPDDPMMPGYMLQELMESEYLDPENDRSSYKFFDLLDRVQYEVDAENYVTEYIYDVHGEVSHKILYADKLSEELLNQLKWQQVIVLNINPERDRTHIYFRDRDGYLIGEKDPAGYVTEYIVDAAGRTTEKIQYSEKKNLFTRDITFDAMRPDINSKQDAHTYKFYDARNQLVSEVDAEAYLTSFIYLPNGLLQQSTRHMEPVPQNWYIKREKPDLSTWPISLEDLVKSYEYDVKNHETSITESNGKKTQKTYDSMGNLQKETVIDYKQSVTLSPDGYRSNQKQYDAFGQITAEANPYIAFELAKIDASDLSSDEKTKAKDTLWATKSTRTSYDPSGLKIQTINTLGHVTRYFYDKERRLAVVIDPTGGVVENTYTSFNDIEKTRKYVTRLSVEQTQCLIGGFVDKALADSLKAIADNANDNVEKFRYDKRSNFHSKTDGENNTNEFEYNAFKEVYIEKLSVNDAENKLQIVHEYDPRGLETKTTRKTAVTEISTEKEYQSLYGKSTSEKDENGNTSIIEHDRLGRTFKHTDALKAENSVTYDALSRPKTETDALKQVTEHQYSQVDRTHTTIRPDKTVASIVTRNVFNEVIKSENGLKQSQVWTHAEDGQELTHTDERDKTSSKQYNTEGLCEFVISANQTKTDLKYNAAKQLAEKVEDSEGLKLKTTYTPNALGSNISVKDPGKIETKNEFDRNLHLKISIKDPSTETKLGLNLRTEMQRNAQGSISTIIRGDEKENNQSCKSFQLDEFNRLTGSTIDPATKENPNALNLISTQKLDKKGNIIAEIEANNNATLYFYNATGQRSFRITATGETTEWKYNLNGNLTSERIFETRTKLTDINENTPLTTIHGLVERSPQDTISYHSYDTNSQEKFVLLSQYNLDKQATYYNVIESFHDAAGNKIKISSYANSISIDNIDNVTTAAIAKIITANPENDRTIFNIYDAAGNERFSIDAMGVVTEQRYNSVNKITAKIIYSNILANPEVLALLAESEVCANLTIDSEQDRAEYIVYDALCRPEFTVDSEQYVTQIQYNENSQPVLTCQFKNKIEIPADYADLEKNLHKLIINDSIDRVITTKYDTAGRVEAVTDALKNTDTYKHDALNNEFEHTDRNKKVWKKTFDRASRLETVTTPVLDDQPAITKKLTYDNVGNVKSETDAFGTAEARTLLKSYDANNQPTQTEHVGGLDPYQKDAKNIILNKVVHNAKKQKIAEQDGSGYWTFYIYNSQNKLTFKIDANAAVIEYKHNAFGEVAIEIQYANALDLNIMAYVETGIGIDLLKEKLKPSSADHTIERQRDQHGNVTQKKNGAKVERKSYNAFRQVIEKKSLINAVKKRWARSLYWLDRNGKLAASSGPNKQVKRLHRNAFGKIEKQEAIHKPLKVDLSKPLSLSQLDASIERIPTKDICHAFEYDLLGQITVEKRLNLMLQEVVTDNETGRSVIKDVLVDEVVKSYRYSPTLNQIAITFADNQVKYFYYDARNKKIAETGVARETTDVNGKPVTIVPLTYFTVNALGQTTDETHFKQGAHVDNLTVTSIPQPLSIDTDDQSTIFKLDKLNRSIGQLVDPGQLKIDTAQTVNLAGLVSTDTDANRHTTQTFYDNKGQKRFVLDPTGGIQEWQHDAFGNISQYRIYHQRFDISTQKVPLDSVALAALTLAMQSVNDSVCSYYYDSSNNERFRANWLYQSKTKSMQAIVHENRYDTHAELIEIVAYAKPIAAIDIAGLTTQALEKFMPTQVDIAHDRHSYIIRDEAGNERFIIDPMGVVTEQVFDTHGDIILSTVFANRADDPENLASLAYEEVSAELKRDSSQDRATYSVFNASRKKEFTVDPEGYVARFAFDIQDNTIGETLFDQAIIVPENYADLVNTLRAIKPDVDHDRTLTYQHDAANQRIAYTDASGFQEKSIRDIFGNKTSLIDRSKAVWQTRWDNANRPYAAISPLREVTEINMVDGKLVPVTKIIALEKRIEFDKVGNSTAITTAFNTDKARTFEATHNELNKLNGSIMHNVAIDIAEKSANSTGRPETTVDIKTTIIRDSNEQIIAEQKENKCWSFTVRDSLGRVIYQLTPVSETYSETQCEYKVTFQSYNTFGEPIKYVEHEKSIILDPSQYNITGVPAEVVQVAINPGDENRSTTYVRNKNGDVINIKGTPVYCFYINAEEKLASTEIEPETQIDRNTFGEVVRHAELLSPDVWKETFSWYNRVGKTIAECKSSGDQDAKPAFAVDCYQFNAFGQEEVKTEFEKRVTRPVDTGLSYADLVKKIVPTIGRDRTLATRYDLRGNITKETRVNVRTYALANKEYNLPDLKETELKDFSKVYTYNAVGLRISTLHEDEKSKDYVFYDACRNKIAETGVTRSSYAVQINSLTHKKELMPVRLTPFTKYGVDAHGKPVLTERFQAGTNAVTDSEFLPMPLPVSEAEHKANDQRELTLTDNRGLTIAQQDPVGSVNSTSFTATKKPARQWSTLSTWKGNDLVPNLDERRFIHDTKDRVIYAEVRRNNAVIDRETTNVKHNVFDEVIAEDFGKGEWEVFSRHDKQGNKWSTNAGKGVSTIILNNLLGQETARIQSPSVDLRDVSYKDVLKLLDPKTSSVTDLEIYSTERDNAGRMTAKISPDSLQVAAVQIIPLQMQVIHRKQDDGEKVFLAYPYPQERNVIAPFMRVKIAGQKDYSITLPVNIEKDGMCLVDVSSLTSDIYEYKLEYYLPDKNGKPVIQLYETTGQVQFDTSNSSASQHIVVTVQSGNLLYLSGNTQGVSFIDLLADDTTKRFAVATDPDTQQLYVDLVTEKSGTYTINTIAAKGTVLQTSLKFMIRTQQTAKEPLATEIPCAAELLLTSEDCTLKLDVPLDLKALPIAFSCKYKDAHGETKTHQENIEYDQEKGYVVNFETPADKIVLFSLAVIKNKDEKFVLYENEKPLEDLAPPPPSSRAEPDFEIVDANEFKHNTTPEDWIDAAVASQDNDDKPAKAVLFKPKQLVYITDTPDVNPKQDSILCKNVGLDRMAAWSKLPVKNVSSKGMVVDVTGMTPGHYPFKLAEGANEYTFLLTQGAEVYESDNVNPAAHYKPVKRSVSYDRWNNVTTEIDSLKNETTTLYDDQNNPIKREEPAINAILPDSPDVITARPTTLSHFDEMGFQDAKMDPNGNTKRFINNEAGECLTDVLGDGIVARTHAFDALQREIAWADGRGKIWSKTQNQNNQTLVLIAPSGIQEEFTYNEAKQFNSSSNGEKEKTRYNHDPSGNVELRIKANGDTIAMTHDRNRQVLTEDITAQDGKPAGSLSWIRDGFGNVIYHIELSFPGKQGALYTYTLNRKKEVRRQTSTAGNHGFMFPNAAALLSRIVDRVRWERWWSRDPWEDLIQFQRVKTPDQDLAFVRHNGRLTQIIDGAHHKVINYSHDTEDREIGCEIWQDGSRIRQRSAVLDATGREIYTFDTLMSLSTGYDLAGNRRHLASSLFMPRINFTIKKDIWNIFDKANRMKDQFSPDGHVQYTYEQNLRKYENGVELSYDDDALLLGTSSGGTSLTVREYDRARRQKEFNDQENRMRTSTRYLPNTDYVSTQTTIKNGAEESRAEFGSYQPSNGQPAHKSIRFDHQHHTDVMNVEFKSFESLQESKVEGRRDGGPSHVAEAFYDANGAPNGQIGLPNVLGRMKDRLMLTGNNGQILEAITVPRTEDDEHDYECFKTGYVHDINFYTVNGQPIATQRIAAAQESGRPDQLNDFKTLLHHTVDENGGLAFVARRGAGEDGSNMFLRAYGGPALKTLKLVGTVQATSASYPPPVPEKHIVGNGETYQMISQRLYGGTEFAYEIAAANGGDVDTPPPIGYELTIPQLEVWSNKAGDYQPYAQFISTMMEALQPSLAMPIPKKERHDIFDTLVKVIAVAAACIIAPQLAIIALPGIMAAGGAGAAIATGVMAGLLNASMQGTAVAVGIEKHFSINDVIETTFTAGAFQCATAGVEVASKAGTTAASKAAATAGKQAATKLLSENTARTVTMMRSAAGASAASQLIEMKLGTRSQFDFKQVLSAAASQYASAKISVPYEGTPVGDIAKTAANMAAGTAINSALYQQSPDFELMAISAVGGQIGNYMGETAVGWLHDNFAALTVPSAPMQQRNRAQVKPVNIPVHKHVAEVNRVAEKKLSGLEIDVTDPEWGHQLSELAREKMVARQARWQAEIQGKTKPGISTASSRFHGDTEHFAADFNNHSEGSIGAQVHAVAHPLETTGRIGAAVISEVSIMCSHTTTKKIISALAYAGDSKLVAGINAVGDTVGSLINPIVAAGESFHDSYVAAWQGHFGRATGDAVLGAVSLIPGGAIATKAAIATKMFFASKGVLAAKSAALVGKMKLSGLSKAEAELAPGLHHLNPNDLRLTQYSASPNFGNNTKVNELIEKLRSGAVSAYDIPPVRAGYKDGKLFSHDNRRIIAYSAAGVEKIPVEIIALKNDVGFATSFLARLNPIREEGRYLVVVESKQRNEARKLLLEHNLILEK